MKTGVAREFDWGRNVKNWAKTAPDVHLRESHFWVSSQSAMRQRSTKTESWARIDIGNELLCALGDLRVQKPLV